MPLRRAFGVAALVFALPVSFALADTTVPSLAGVRGAMQTSDAKKLFDRSMSGAPQPDGFGTALPAGFTTAWLVDQLAPGQDVRDVVLSGAKPWPLRPNSYVAMLCLADSPEKAAAARKYAAATCDSLGDDSDARRVWFGVFDSMGTGAPRLVARTMQPVATPTDWSDTNIDQPVALENGDAGSAQAAMPSSWSRFDLAAYQLRAGQYAFGVRAGWSEGYAGGGADFEALYLFVIDGNALKVAFAQPMAFDKMLAGDWNKDGTRSHDVSDAANALTVLPTVTGGYHDLQLREKARGKWRRTFKWSVEKGRYE
ncbi:hypothetical protein FAZ98_29850 [Paraburkholderia acidisoli]|uniref:Uncharacterized protein n=1 Tax=Paraburkholderia acidisoli TaxID=2571748 RepID=A0A7Z2GRY0_9BURK|nr:hypothetical protein FAZ98_29850 [Paraburkholderia acidisoli]